MWKKYLSYLVVLFLLPLGYIWGYAEGQGSAFAPGQVAQPSVAELAEHPSLQTLWRVWDLLEEKYVDTAALDRERMLQGAIKGVVRSLGDPHSEYMDPIETKEFIDSLTGSLTGIGAEIGLRDELLIVISPLRGSPAEAAGLLPEDIIYKIDGKLATDYSLFEAVQNIRGPVGTSVTLTIMREGEELPREVTIVRDFIDVKSVELERLAENIALITINTFAEDTSAEFTKVLNELALEKPRGVIIDLRFNGGGILEAAIEMTSRLLASGTVVQIRERGQPDDIVPVSGAVILPETPLVVLINEGSASASEIMAGALQDSGRATVIGMPSFGKGTVQEPIELPDGSLLKVTVAKWYTPSGRDVTAEGIHPDLEVPMTAADLAAKQDPQLAAAVQFLSQ